MPESDLPHRLAGIEQLITELDQQPPDAMPPLMRERLEAARFYLTGGLAQEYDFNLKLAHELLPEIADPALRSRIEALLNAERGGV